MKNTLLAEWLAAGSLLFWPCAQSSLAEEQEEAAEPTTEVRGPIAVSGRLLVRRLDGEVEPLSEGSLRLQIVVPTERAHPHVPGQVIRGTSQRGMRVAVEDGSFSFEVPPETHPIRVTGLDARNLRALIDPPEATFDPEAKAVELEAVEIAATLLRLYAPETEAVIEEEVQVVHLTRGKPRPHGRHPGLGKTYARLGGGGPIELWPSDLTQLEYQVRAPGFAWTPLTLDIRGGKRGMLLETAGHLEVDTPRQQPWDKVLRLRGLDGKLHSEGHPIGRHRFSDLPVGIWSVSAEGPRLANPRVYGRATVLVVEGETTRVSLVLAAIPEVELTPFCGTLVIPAEWELPSPEVLIENLDPNSATPERTLAPADQVALPEQPDEYRFNAGALEPGRYRMTLTGSPLRTFFEVPSNSTDEALLKLPPSTELSIAFVDAEDGSPVEPRNLLWHVESPDGWIGASSGGSYPIPRVAPGKFEGRIASGRVNLTLWGAPRYRNWSQTVDLSVEGLSRRVELVRRTGLSLLLRRPEEESRIYRSLRVEAIDSPEGGRIHEAWSMRHEITYEANLPGTYLLHFTPPPGYAAIPDREVVILSGALTPIEVELVPQ